MKLTSFTGDDLSSFERIAEIDKRSGPCDDDCEVTAPFISILPDESAHEDGSPLDFGGNNTGDGQYRTYQDIWRQKRW